MLTALIVQTATSPGSGLLGEALSTCGFTVTQDTAWPDPLQKDRWDVIVTHEGAAMSQPHEAADASHSVGRYRLWQPRAAATSAPHAGVALDCPARLTDVALLLLACGHSPVSRQQQAALFDELSKLCDGNDAIVSELTQTIITANDDDLVTLQNALSGGCCADVTSIAHRLKSVAKMLGCLGLFAVCDRLERKVSQFELGIEAAVLVALIRAGFFDVNSALRLGPPSGSAASA